MLCPYHRLTGGNNQIVIIIKQHIIPWGFVWQKYCFGLYGFCALKGNISGLYCKFL